MSDAHDTRRSGGRAAWLILAVVAILAIVGLVLFMNNGRDETPAAQGSAGQASAEIDAPGAERAIEEAAADTAQALDTAGEAAEDAGAALAEGAQDAAQAAENAVERSTDGNPDSDNNEPNR